MLTKNIPTIKQIVKTVIIKTFIPKLFGNLGFYHKSQFLNLTKICLVPLFISCKQDEIPTKIGKNYIKKCSDTIYKHQFIGEYKLCHPNNDELRIKFELKNPVIEKKYCFIPTYQNSITKKAIYLGEPRCLFIKFPDTPVEITLLKNRKSIVEREDYSLFPINSVMILIDEVHTFPPPFIGPIPTVEAYLKCTEYIDSKDDSSYCQAFKKMHFYTFHQFSG